MPHELLLACGGDGEPSRRRRRVLVDHAATRVPRAVGARVVETPHACLAVVDTTSPGGVESGDVAVLSEDGLRTRATLALHAAGVDAAGRGDGGAVGAEAAHVAIATAADGDTRISTDGFAILGCFWAEQDGALLVSTHLASLVSLGLPAVVDEVGILEYMSLLHPLGERTVLSQAHLLPPGGALVWDPSSSASVTARPLFSPRGPGLGDGEALDVFRDVWATVISDVASRNEGRRSLVGLSGGLDSRAVVAEYVRQDRAPVTYTYGGAGTREVAIATRLAERLDLPHVTIPVDDAHLLANAVETTHLLDGAHAATEMYESWFRDRLHALTDVVVNGLAGGPLWGDDKLMGLHDQASMADQAWNRYAGSAGAAGRFLQPGRRADMEPAVRASLASSVADWGHLDRNDVGIYWRIATRQFRWGNMLMTALRRDGIVPETPFLDGRFLAFAADLTPDQRRNGRLYLRAHREVFPATADLPRSDDGNAPADLDHVYWAGDVPMARQLAGLARRHPVAALRRAGRHGLDVAAEQVRAATGDARAADRRLGQALVFPGESWARTRPQYARRLAALLDGAARLPELFDTDVVERGLADLRRGGGQYSAAAMGKVGALAAWVHDHRDREARRLAVESSVGPAGTP